MSIITQIENRINSFGRGSIFYPDDYLDLGTSEAIRQSLTRLCKDEKIVRVGQGIYCYPQIDKELGHGIIKPTSDEIARSLAKRDHARIVPTGSYAQHVLGLSTQIPLNCVYMTDGSARHLELYNGRKITFKRTTPKNLSFTSKLAMLITFALKSLGKMNIEQTVIKRIRELLKNEPKSEVMKDLSLMPEWIRNIVTEAYE